MNIRVHILLSHILSKHYYNNVSLLDVKNFIDCFNSCLTFDEEFKAFLFYSRNKSIIDKLFDIIMFDLENESNLQMTIADFYYGENRIEEGDVL